MLAYSASQQLFTSITLCLSIIKNIRKKQHIGNEKSVCIVLAIESEICHFLPNKTSQSKRKKLITENGKRCL